MSIYTCLQKKVIKKIVTIRAGSWSLMLGATISTNFPGKFTLESFAWCMFGLNVARRKPHLIRLCGHDPVQGVGCVGQGSILADPTRLTNAIDIRQRYPNCFLRAHLLVISWLGYFHTYFAFRGSLVPSGFLDRIRQVSTVSRCFALNSAADVQQPLRFPWNISTQAHFIAAGLEYANNSSAIIV